MADHGGARGMAFAADGSKLACSGITNVSNAFAGVGNPAVVLIDWKSGKSTPQDEGGLPGNGLGRRVSPGWVRDGRGRRQRRRCLVLEGR